jgi:hypothetical protein
VVLRRGCVAKFEEEKGIEKQNIIFPTSALILFHAL